MLSELCLPSLTVVPAVFFILRAATLKKFYDDDDDDDTNNNDNSLSVEYFQGKLEMELEILTESQANERPAGTARDDPNQHPTLDPPQYVDLFSFAFLLTVIHDVQ